jgi:Nucleotidyl transferase AbiEii toxin, Type IV TA system
VSGADRSSGWARLFRTACSLIKQVNSNERIIDYWTFGGSTAMMLQINHRESHDVDLFLNEGRNQLYQDIIRRNR